MVIAGYELLDHLPVEKRCPFAVCYIHANVLDAAGRRMSKSLGNGIDPLDMIEQYGADAVRFMLVWMTTEGQDVKLDPQRFEMGRNFMNKLWNALSRTTTEVARALEGYHFSVAAQAIYECTWRAFCDWYLELIKGRMRAGGDSAEEAKATLHNVLSGICRMLHPIAPHISEEIWSRLPGERGLLALTAWGDEDFQDEGSVVAIDTLQEVIRTVRNLRAESRVPAKAEVDVVVRPGADSADAAEALREHAHHLHALARVSGLTVDAAAEPPAENASAVLAFADVYVDLEGKIDRAAERVRLEKEREKVGKALVGCERKLANEGFVNKAAAEVVQRERDRLEELRAQVARLDENLGRL